MSANIERVAMTPDETVIWERHDLPDLGGALYYPLDAPMRYGDIAIKLSLRHRMPELEWVADGTSAKIWRVDDETVAKRHKIISSVADYTGLSSLRANVALQEGFTRIEPLAVVGPDNQDYEFTFRAPQMRAAFISNRPLLHPRFRRTVWVMDRIKEKSLYKTSIPHQVQLSGYYDQALATCGFTPDQLKYVDYDNQMRNHRAFDAGSPRTADVVKFDIWASDSLDF